MGAGALDEQPGPERGSLRRGQPAVEQPVRVIDGPAPHGRLARQQPAVRGAVGIARGEGVLGHQLRLVGGQVGRPSVVRRGQGRWQGRVHALLDQVVDEVVAPVADHQQPHPGQLLALPDHLQLGPPAEHGQLSRVQPPAEHRRGSQHVAGLRVQAVDARQDGRGEGRRHPGVARGEGAQALDDAERVPSRAGHHRRPVPSQPRGGRERVHRRAGQRAQVDDAGAVAEAAERVGVLRADGAHEQDPGSPEPLGEVAEQLDRGRPGVLEVVEGDQHRGAPGQRAQRGRDRVVRPPPLELGGTGTPRGHAGPDDRSEVGEQQAPGVLVTAHQRGVPARGRRGAGPVAGRRRRAGGTVTARSGGSGTGAPRRPWTRPGRRSRPGGGSCRSRPRPRRRPARPSSRPRPSRPARGPRGPPPDRPGWVGTTSRAGPVSSAGGVARSRSRCTAAVAASGSVPRSPRRRRASSSYVARAAAVRPAAAWARIRSRTARSSNGSVATASAATSDRRGRVGRRQRRGQQVPGPGAQGVRLAAHVTDPVGVRLVQQCRRGPEQVQSTTRARGGQPVLPGAAATGGVVEQRARLVEIHGPVAVDQTVGPARSRGQRVPEQPAAAADERGHVRSRVRGRTVGPEHVDDPVHRDQAAAFGGQQGQQRARLAGAEVAAPHGHPVDLHGERGADEDPDPSAHASSFPDLESISVGSGGGTGSSRRAAGRTAPSDGQGTAPPSGGVSLRPSLRSKVKESGPLREMKAKKPW